MTSFEYVKRAMNYLPSIRPLADLTRGRSD